MHNDQMMHFHDEIDRFEKISNLSDVLSRNDSNLSIAIHYFEFNIFYYFLSTNHNLSNESQTNLSNQLKFRDIGS